MHRILGCVLLVAAMLAPQVLSADDALEEVLVSGEQPGPGLWKVTSGENTLWILGRYGPLPKAMRWQSAQVESVLAQSQELLGPPEVDSNIGFFRGMRLLPSLLRARANADGKVLKDLLTAEQYARWARLKQRYIGRADKMERWRPMFAGLDLAGRARRDAGLADSDVVSPVIKRVARKYHIKVTNPAVRIEIEDPKRLIADFRDTAAEADVACLVSLMDTVEFGLDDLRVRANAWATGDIETLRQGGEEQSDNACIVAATDVPSIKQRFDAALELVRSRWLEAAVLALQNNRSTFAVLPMSDVLASDGAVERLRAMGYTVVAP
ncbi:MAG: TraB/GumN family protein [Pseudomonadota bacterium]